MVSLAFGVGWAFDIDSIAFMASLVAAQHLRVGNTLLIEVRSYTFDQLGFVLERATLAFNR